MGKLCVGRNFEREWREWLWMVMMMWRRTRMSRSTDLTVGVTSVRCASISDRWSLRWLAQTRRINASVLIWDKQWLRSLSHLTRQTETPQTTSTLSCYGMTTCCITSLQCESLGVSSNPIPTTVSGEQGDRETPAWAARPVTGLPSSSNHHDPCRNNLACPCSLHNANAARRLHEVDKLIV